MQIKERIKNKTKEIVSELYKIVDKQEERELEPFIEPKKEIENKYEEKKNNWRAEKIELFHETLKGMIDEKEKRKIEYWTRLKCVSVIFVKSFKR